MIVILLYYNKHIISNKNQIEFCIIILKRKISSKFHYYRILSERA